MGDVERIREWRDALPGMARGGIVEGWWHDVDVLLNEIDRLRESDVLFMTRVPERCFVCGEPFTDANIVAQLSYTRNPKDISWWFWHAGCDDRSKELLGDE